MFWLFHLEILKSEHFSFVLRFLCGQSEVLEGLHSYSTLERRFGLALYCYLEALGLNLRSWLALSLFGNFDAWRTWAFAVWNVALLTLISALYMMKFVLGMDLCIFFLDQLGSLLSYFHMWSSPAQICFFRELLFLFCTVLNMKFLAFCLCFVEIHH